MHPRLGDAVLGIALTLAAHELLDLATGALVGGVADFRAAFASGGTLRWYVLGGLPWSSKSFFRGFLWRGVEKRLGTWASLLITTLMFLMIHDGSLYANGVVNWSVVASLGATGLTFGWSRWRTGGTTAPMLAHAVLNMLLDWIVIAVALVKP